MATIGQSIIEWQLYLDAWKQLIERTSKLWASVNRETIDQLIATSLKNDQATQALFLILEASFVPQPEEVLSHLLDYFVNPETYGDLWGNLALASILMIPQKWLLDNIEIYAEHIVSTGGEDEYRWLFTLYRYIDNSLVINLAKYALSKKEENIQKLGADELRRLNIKDP